MGEVALVGKRSGTEAAMVRPLPCVTAHMCGDMVFESERLSAPRERTRVRTLACMNALVGQHLASVVIPVLAEPALETVLG